MGLMSICAQPKLAPVQAVDVVSDRMRQIGKLNTSVADWLQVRIFGAKHGAQQWG